MRTKFALIILLQSSIPSVAFSDSPACTDAFKMFSELSSRFETAVSVRRDGYPMPTVDLQLGDRSLVDHTNERLNQCSLHGDNSSFDKTVVELGGNLTNFAQHYQRALGIKLNLNPSFLGYTVSSKRPKIAILDTGIPVTTQNTFFQEVEGKSLNLVHPLSPEITWDLGDGDSVPDAVHPHGKMVLNVAIDTLKALSLKGFLKTEADVPVFLPFKRYNILENTAAMYEGGPVFLKMRAYDTESAEMAKVLESVSPRIINMSGGFDDPSIERYESVRRFLMANPRIILVNAAGNQKVDIDDVNFKYPWPSKFLDDNGNRLPNIVNVTTHIGDITRDNWGDKFVDVAVNARSSFAAPQVAALLGVIDGEFPGCLDKRLPIEILKSLSKAKTKDHGIPILSKEDVTRVEIQRVCNQ